MTLAFNKQFQVTKANGFTLLELIIVLVLIGLVSSLVGGLSVDRVNKVGARLEYAEFVNLTKSVSSRAFYLHSAVIIEVNGKQAKVYELNRQEPLAEFTYQDLFFEPQSIRINKNGIPDIQQISFHWKGRPETLELY